MDANDALDLVSRWMKRNHLQLAPEKTEALYLTGRKRRRGVHLLLDGHPIEIKKKAKYLGVMLDTGLTGNEHIKYIAEKAQKVSRNLARILPRVGGASEGKRRLLASVAESTAMYASPIWAEMALRTAKNRKLLRAAQRIMAIRVCRSYRTVSTDALLIIAKMIPWDLLAGERRAQYLERVATGDADPDETRKATLDEWQREWEQGLLGGRPVVGAWTRSLIPDLRPWVLSDFGELSYWVTQVLTGHGQFQRYMLRIGESATDTCV